MAFAKSHDFSIGTFIAVDGSVETRKTKELRPLLKNACLGASHRSEERYDAPKCHPETRKAVIKDIMSWVNSRDVKQPMMWMSGPAGAGKSSIAQTVCEKCHDEGSLLASFFFSRTAVGTGRDNANRLVPTIAIQLANVVPDTKDLIINALESNPAILSYSMEVQMQKLVLDPLAEASPPKLNENVESPQAVPWLVVIDGLDECNDPRMQARIITSFSAILANTETRIRFLFASRPELEIRSAFHSSKVSNQSARIVLNELYNPDDDIRVYLQSEFALLIREHPLNSRLSQECAWPSPHDIEWLVAKSSGQFIYASTIMLFLKHLRRDPRVALASIISESSAEMIQTTYKESPYSQLDVLYRHILQNAVSNFQSTDDSIINIFQVLLFAFKSSFWSQDLLFVCHLAPFLCMEEDRLLLLLSDLHSIVYVPNNTPTAFLYYGSGSLLNIRPHQAHAPPKKSTHPTPALTKDISFYHASFGDFLTNPSRSREFFIDEVMAHNALAHYCFSRLTEHHELELITLDVPELYSLCHYFEHIKKSKYDDALLEELHSESNLRKIFCMLVQLNNSSDNETISLVNKLLKCFFKFDFDDQNSCFAIPINYKVKDMCALMTRIVDEQILSECSLTDLADRWVVISITEISLCHQRETSIILCWLSKLLEIPERGKHLYLDPDNSLRLYSKICTSSGFRKACVGDWGTEVIRYLLDKIEPSEDLDLTRFRSMTKHIINEISIESKRREARELLKRFIQKCLESSRKASNRGDEEKTTAYRPGYVIPNKINRPSEGVSQKSVSQESSSSRRLNFKSTIVRWFSGLWHTSSFK